MGRAGGRAGAGLTRPHFSGKERVAVVRVSGGIVGGSGTGDSTITAPAVIRTLEALSSTPKIKAVVLHINSGGGDALASDLMWRAVAKLAANKPVVACMGDVAASGGYYIAMGAHHIVAQVRLAAARARAGSYVYGCACTGRGPAAWCGDVSAVRFRRHLVPLRSRGVRRGIGRRGRGGRSGRRGPRRPATPTDRRATLTVAKLLAY